ncbi:hypothetical protein CALCODRAFT_489227 [Calocera cornea HHB12733]|uniref:Uncharacterized protein n=1 Tax=Calocera cornea HHB12733 TaxID=1353952 RepID=A0A165K6I1_9BASI|nr:hypothetical protein CALCODRAFT_489227 [Calocera cornea HHB12733]
MPVTVSHDAAGTLTPSIDSASSLDLSGVISTISDILTDPPVWGKALGLITSLTENRYDADPRVAHIQRRLDACELAYTLIESDDPEDAAAVERFLEAMRTMRRALNQSVALQQRQRARDEEEGVRDGERLPAYDPAWWEEREQRGFALSATGGTDTPVDRRPRLLLPGVQATVHPYDIVVLPSQQTRLSSNVPAVPHDSASALISGAHSLPGPTSSILPRTSPATLSASARATNTSLGANLQLLPPIIRITAPPDDGSAPRSPRPADDRELDALTPDEIETRFRACFDAQKLRQEARRNVSIAHWFVRWFQSPCGSSSESGLAGDHTMPLSIRNRPSSTHQ